MAVFNFVLYLLAVVTCLGCTVLLFRSYAATGARIVLWTAACFVGLSLNNVLLFVDLVVLPVEVDLRISRYAAALAGLACLLYGFIWEGE